MHIHKTSKFAIVYSLESFTLYGKPHMHNINDQEQLCAHWVLIADGIAFCIQLTILALVALS